MTRSVLLANHGSLRDSLELAAVAHAAGARRVWCAETDGPDAFVAAALIAASLPVEVGTSIVSVSTRSPAVLAMAAADLTHAGGRAVHLGIGAGGQRIVQGWHGQDFHDPVTRVGETLAVLRQALSGQRTSFHGTHVVSEGFRLAAAPVAPVRLHVGGMGPRMTALAATRADGLILSWSTEAEVRRRRAELDDLVRSAERPAGSVRLLARSYVAVTDDPRAVRAAVREELVGYLVSPPYASSFRAQGFPDEVEAVQRGFAMGDRAGAAAGVSERLLDEMLIAGDAGLCQRRLAALATAGADEVLVQAVPAARGGDPVRTFRATLGAG